MTIAQYVFWLAMAVVLYTYFVYPIALWGVCRIVRLTRRAVKPTGRESLKETLDWPTVSIVVAAFNEEACLPSKLSNSEGIDYPPGRLEFVFVSDGSTDRTDELLSRLNPPRYQFLRLARRMGKPSALNEAASLAKGEILVFSDASTALDCGAIRRLVGHFGDPQVGVVCGAPSFGRSAESKATEGLYWSYETALRRMEGQIGATLTASGTIYAMRRACFRPLPADAILDDFLIPMTARRLGYKVLYEPEARAWETAPATVRDEFIRRARLAAGSFGALGPLMRAALLSPSLLWAFVSHKLLRWLVPLCLIAMAGSSLTLVREPLYRWAFLLQAMLYLWAIAGLFFRDQLAKLRFGLVAYFLVAMNMALLVGMARWVTHRQSVTWTRVDG